MYYFGFFTAKWGKESNIPPSRQKSVFLVIGVKGLDSTGWCVLFFIVYYYIVFVVHALTCLEWYCFPLL